MNHPVFLKRALEPTGGARVKSLAAMQAEDQTTFTFDAAEIRRAIRGRRLRDRYFGAGLFEEPAWDMILELFASELEGKNVIVKTLCEASAVAPTTALRWVTKLVDAGIFEREADPLDRRRSFVKLADQTVSAVREYLASMRRAGLSLA